MWDGMPRTGHTLTNNLVYNNIIYNNSSTIATSDLFIRQNDGNDIVGNVSDYNCHLSLDGGDPVDAAFHAGIGGAIQRWRRDKTDLASWRTLTGWDTHSISANPAFVSGVGTDWTLSPASPAKDIGTNLAEVPTDTSEQPARRGVPATIGAFEVPDTTAPVIAVTSPTSKSHVLDDEQPVALSGTATDDTGNRPGNLGQQPWWKRHRQPGLRHLERRRHPAARWRQCHHHHGGRCRRQPGHSHLDRHVVVQRSPRGRARISTRPSLRIPNFSGTNADPNRNGILNLAEYAFGGRSGGSATGRGILPSVGRSAGNTLQTDLPRYLDRTDLTLTVEAADSLAGAVDGPGAEYRRGTLCDPRSRCHCAGNRDRQRAGE